ncbi:hypothetical protein [Mariniblastus fucicola]|uniref:Uncharacterized protein n=1 Tax=Mariniblastus fucicola TaxID=980251 RepID=A0A5B9P326_9BACT|nr:hypothetical protein [Mariniblastus fucicola]QEG20564.1 hypothetical protein MFFC18_04130 [Mariniblastus fucicola]
MHSRPANFTRTTKISQLLALFVLIGLLGHVDRSDAQIMRSPNSAQASEQPKSKWPPAIQLLKELTAFEEFELTKAWAVRTKELAEYLCDETEVTSEEAVEALMALNQQRQAVTPLIQQISISQPSGGLNVEAAELVSELQRFQYRLGRRIEVWAGVIDHAKAVASKKITPVRTVSLSSLPENLDELLQKQIPNNTGWQEYLAWDALVEAASVSNMDKNARRDLREASQKFLARYHSPSLTDAQRDLFQPFFAPEILTAIRDAASDEVDHTMLMKLIEMMEQKHSGKYATYLNNEYQNLLWSEDPVANELAATIDSHWRNANFRIAINQRMLNQMLPQVPAMTEPVSERIQGAKVSGQSLIENQLRIALIPNPNEISLGIETIGHVTSETVAKRSGFIFENRGLADFKVFQKLAFSRTGVTSEEAQATSTARQRLTGLRGSYDRVPLVGWLTRKIAKQKAEEQTPEALKLTKHRVETGAKQRVEQEVNDLVQQLRKGIHEVVLSRLISMDLEPETVQLSTSNQRIVGRYRVAGRDQMAAWQPRPTDFESDLLTVQFHQSALNNLIERFGINGKKFDAITLGQHIEKITGIPYESKNTEAEATFQFEKYDGVRVDFEDGIASVTFSFRRFQIGNGRPWKKIKVTTSFVPKYIGTRVVLDRVNLSEVVSEGSDLRLADQIAIRGAFKVILDRQYAFDLLPAAVREKVPGLALGIGRLSLAEGWCGVALDNASNLNQPVPIVAPEEVVPGSWSDQLGSFQPEASRVETPRTARRLKY